LVTWKERNLILYQGISIAGKEIFMAAFYSVPKSIKLYFYMNEFYAYCIQRDDDDDGDGSGGSGEGRRAKKEKKIEIFPPQR
jgi:hypothetical protein